MITTKKLWIIGLLYGAATFVLSPSFQNVINNPVFWNIKEQLLYFTGSIAMAYMVISMALTVKSAKISNLMGGLNKVYVAHKWIGIWAFAFSILHWVVKESPAVLVALNLAPPRVRPNGASPFSDFEKALFDFGNNIGEIAFYIMVVVLVVSLLKKVPPHIFRRTHKALSVLFLVIAFHSATIQIKGQWFGSIGSVLLFVMIIIGSAAAVYDLIRLISKSRRVKRV